MPVYDITTNVKLEGEELKAFLLEFTKFGTKLVDMPTEDFTYVAYNYQENLIFGGSFEPAFKLDAAAFFNAETNPERSAALFKFLGERLNVKENRGLIEFRNPGPDFIGAMGTTVAVLKQRRAQQ